MRFSISPCDALKGDVKAPASKSYTIRAVLSSLLCDGESRIGSPLISRDTKASFNAAGMLGADIRLDEDEAVVGGVGSNIRVPQMPIDCMNSGTTIRIATAISSLAGQHVELTGDGSVRSRPIKELTSGLRQLGVEANDTDGRPPVRVKGPLIGGNCEMAGDISSQYISAILMAAPYSKEGVTLKLTTDLKSKPYVDLTLNMLELYQVRVENEGYSSFHIPGNQTYRKADYTVEGDYSSAAFILAAAALTSSDVTVRNLFPDSLQADKKIVDILRLMGADVKVGKDQVRIKSEGSLGGVTVDLSDSPDLVPIMATLGVLADGKSEIVNTEHARYKECDRIKAMHFELSKMGADIREKPDGLVMEGSTIKGTAVSGWKDHRIIMALAVAALKAEGETVVDGAEHVDVTFPNFKELMNGLGAGIS